MTSPFAWKRPAGQRTSRASTCRSQPKAIIGRERELAAARQRLLRADVRLLTLTGPPAWARRAWPSSWRQLVADEFEDGVSFVDLAPISDARLVIDAVARGLGLRDVDRRVAVEVVEEFLQRPRRCC